MGGDWSYGHVTGTGAWASVRAEVYTGMGQNLSMPGLKLGLGQVLRLEFGCVGVFSFFGLGSDLDRGQGGGLGCGRDCGLGWAWAGARVGTEICRKGG